MNNYEWLISSLDAFIRKFYINQVIRGTLVFLTSLLLFILLVSVGEYYLYFPVWLRIAIAAIFVVAGAGALALWVIVPLSKMARLGKVISHEQAAQIIGQHFNDVDDKLLNILQLKKQGGGASRELAEASINQKISQIQVVPMLSAIDLGKNRRYLPYLLPLLLIGVFILVAAPNVFKESTKRLLQPARTFEKPAPFRFILKNNTLTVTRNADLQLKLEVVGDILPAQAAIEVDGTDDKLPMQILEGHQFQYTFRNVTRSFSFRFFAGGFYSGNYTVKVVQKPVLKSFRININYPGYIGRKNEVRASLGDMTLPAGTSVSWQLMTEYADEATIRFGAAGTNVAIPNK